MPDERRDGRTDRWGYTTFTLPHPVLKAVGVSALFATEVDEEVRGSGRVLRGHVPHDPERVAGHLTNLDVTGGGEGGFHFCHLPGKRGYFKQRVIWINSTTGDWQHVLKEINFYHKWSLPWTQVKNTT